MFQPVSIQGHDYVDGGLVEPVPVDSARAMGADFVIAVNISADPSAQKNAGQSGVLLQTTAIMGQSINKMALSRADVEEKFRGNCAYGGWSADEAERFLAWARKVFGAGRVELAAFRT